jgi:protein-S-isoprenylcysteine O-methyltransferase Ste14
MEDGLVKRWIYKPVLGTLFYTLVIPGSIVGLVPYMLLTLRFHLIPMHLGIFYYFGLLPILLGVITYSWAAWDFILRGKGTPSPIAQPKTLVVSGPYRILRNPMYLGLLLILSGEAIFFQEVILIVYTCLFFVSFHRHVINNEEPSLTWKYGANYKLYCHAIPRWFPKIRLG